MTTEPERGIFLRRWLLLLPPLVMLGLLFVFQGWGVVWGDDVSMSPLFDKFYRSTLTLGDLWEPYQGHRIFFPRALELLFGWATHWNVSVEIGFVYVTFLVDFGLLYWLLQDLRTALSERTRLLLAAVMSLSVFSTSQVENWINGWQMGLALSTVSVLIGLVLLAKFGARLWTLLVCILAGVVASYSFGNGVLYWIALVPLLHGKLRADSRWPAKSLLWAAAAGAVIFFYFHGLGSSGQSMTLSQSALHILKVPGTFFTYLLTCAGAGVFFLNGAKASLPPAGHLLVVSAAPVWGFIGLAAFAYTGWRLLRRGGPGLLLLAPWLSLGLYGVFSVGLISLARYTFPPESAISSRYITFSQYLWLALFVFLALLAPRVSKAWAWSLGGAMAVCYLISYGNGLRHDRTASAQLKQIRADLLGQPTAQTYLLLNPDRDPEQLAGFVEIMRQRRLAIFHDPAANP